MKINHVSVVSIPVTDQQAAKAFYTEKLGFTLIRENPMGPDQQWVQVGPAGAETSFTLVTWFPQMAPGSVQGVVLATDDVVEAHATLQERGVGVSAVENAPWGTFLTFSDPDGNGFVLQQNTPGF